MYLYRPANPELDSENMMNYEHTRALELFATLDNITNTNYTINRAHEMAGFTGMDGFKLHF